MKELIALKRWNRKDWNVREILSEKIGIFVLATLLIFGAS